MPIIAPAALERELTRGMRPDAYRYIRPDWRRQVKPGSDLWALYERFERKYSPNQPRVPAGVREGGQWSSEGEGRDSPGGKPTGTVGGSNRPIEVAPATSKGHHYVPKAVYEKAPIPPDAKQVFDEATTGRLQDTRSNQYDKDHRQYNEAVKQEFDKFVKERNIQPEQMTVDQAEEFVGKVVGSTDPRIRNFNMRIQIREIMRGVFRRMRGTE